MLSSRGNRWGGVGWRRSWPWRRRRTLLSQHNREMKRTPEWISLCVVSECNAASEQLLWMASLNGFFEWLRCCGNVASISLYTQCVMDTNERPYRAIRSGTNSELGSSPTDKANGERSLFNSNSCLKHSEVCLGTLTHTLKNEWWSRSGICMQHRSNRRGWKMDKWHSKAGCDEYYRSYKPWVFMAVVYEILRP